MILPRIRGKDKRKQKRLSRFGRASFFCFRMKSLRADIIPLR